MKKFVKAIRGFLITLLIIALLSAAGVLLISEYVKNEAKDGIITTAEAVENSDYDCIIVLGCQVRGQSPSPMLADRLKKGVELYKDGVAPKLLMSGDHSTKYYDEVDIMKNYAIDEGVPSSDVFMDHAGLSTYDSIYRAKEIFDAKRVLIVTQEYHLYRALYIAKKLGVEARGVACDTVEYSGQEMRDLREIGARNKAFLYGIIKPTSTYLGEGISLDGDGDITNDSSR